MILDVVIDHNNFKMLKDIPIILYWIVIVLYKVIVCLCKLIMVLLQFINNNLTNIKYKWQVMYKNYISCFVLKLILLNIVHIASSNLLGRQKNVLLTAKC